MSVRLLTRSIDSLLKEGSRRVHHGSVGKGSESDHVGSSATATIWPRSMAGTESSACNSIIICSSGKLSRMSVRIANGPVLAFCPFFRWLADSSLADIRAERNPRKIAGQDPGGSICGVILIITVPKLPTTPSKR